jgi:hypothetical protein
VCLTDADDCVPVECEEGDEDCEPVTCDGADNLTSDTCIDNLYSNKDYWTCIKFADCDAIKDTSDGTDTGKNLPRAFVNYIK